MREPDVIQHTRAFLLREGLLGYAFQSLYTDAHPTLTPIAMLTPFQRFTLALDGLSVHPDLVGQLADGETTVAIEAKGLEDQLKGISQAEAYGYGFHLVLLACVDPPGVIQTMAEHRRIGLLNVGAARTELLYLPPPHLPQRQLARSIQRQFATTSALNNTFLYNLPTHYLAVAIALRGRPSCTRQELQVQLGQHYPAGPADLSGMIRGAQSIGLIAVRHDQLALTPIGLAAVDLLPDLPALNTLHSALKASASTTLAALSPTTGAVLRWLLVSNPVTTLITDTLTAAGRALTMTELAQLAYQRDRATAQIAFFAPTQLDALLTKAGDLADFRFSCAYQMIILAPISRPSQWAKTHL